MAAQKATMKHRNRAIFWPTSGQPSFLTPTGVSPSLANGLYNDRPQLHKSGGGQSKSEARASWRRSYLATFLRATSDNSELIGASRTNTATSAR
jgi:hypothetical protein